MVSKSYTSFIGPPTDETETFTLSEILKMFGDRLMGEIDKGRQDRVELMLGMKVEDVILDHIAVNWAWPTEKGP